MCLCAPSAKGIRSRTRVTGSVATMWVLGTEPRVSARATSTLNHSAISSFFLPSFFLFSFEKESYYVALNDLDLSQILLPLLHVCWD